MKTKKHLSDFGILHTRGKKPKHQKSHGTNYLSAHYFQIHLTPNKDRKERDSSHQPTLGKEDKYATNKFKLK